MSYLCHYEYFANWQIKDSFSEARGVVTDLLILPQKEQIVQFNIFLLI